MSQLILILFLLTSLPLKAQEALSSSTKEDPVVAGVIQYLDGEAIWENKKRWKAKYKSPIQHGDQLTLTDGTLLKIVDRKFCIGVFYGPGVVRAPGSAKERWQIQVESARWICPDGSSKLQIKGGELDVSDGEILFSEEKLLVRQPEVSSKDEALFPNRYYQLRDKNWVIDERILEATEIWDFHNSLKIPKESLEMPEPFRQVQRRWIAAFGQGSGTVQHDGGSFESDDLDAFSIKLLHERLWGENKSLRFSLNVRDYDFKEGGPIGFEENDVDGVATLFFDIVTEMGIRYNHSRSWSFYTDIGLGIARTEGLSDRIDTNGKPVVFEAKHLMGTIALGIEKIFFEEWINWRWLGLKGIYTALEFNASTSFTTLSSDVLNTSTDGINLNFQDGDEEAGVSHLGLMIYIGFPLQF